jgi:L-lysine exporter family protein LysE/ArgO
VVICSVCDAVLIAAGVAGASVALTGRHWLVTVLRTVGAVLLVAYASLAARRVMRPPTIADLGRASGSSRVAVVGTCLAFTWLNPAVYLDTVVLLGSVANTRRGHEWWFGGGAATGSLLWFVALGCGGALLAPLLKRPAVSRLLDAFVTVVMTTTAARLAFAS